MRSTYRTPPRPAWQRDQLPVRYHDPRWYRHAGQPTSYPAQATSKTAVPTIVLPKGAPPLPPEVLWNAMPPKRRTNLTRALRRHGGLVRASRMSPQERLVAAMRAAQARWEKATDEEHHQVGQALLQARRQRVQLIPASTQLRLAIWNPSMERKPCEVCGTADAEPYQRSLLQMHVWTWRCRRHASARRGKL